MRLLRARVPRSDLDAVRSALADEDVAYVLTPEVSDGSEAVVVECPVPDDAVDDVLDGLSTAGVDDSTYLSVSAIETARAPGIDDLEARYVEGSDGREGMSFEEIRTAAREMHPNTPTYYAMTLLSAIVATAGLLIDSPAVVVGAMVIAPQVSSALLTGLGTVTCCRRGCGVRSVGSRWRWSARRCSAPSCAGRRSSHRCST